MYRIVTFGKCFADPIAIRVMKVAMTHNVTIQDLQKVLDLDRHTIDLRLLKLREARILVCKQAGRWLEYSMHPDARPVVERMLTNFYDEVRWDQKIREDEERLNQLIKESQTAAAR